MIPWRPVKGGEAEDAAAAWCRDRGWQVVRRNFRVKGGEIDLICLDDATLVFVEVRKRRDNRYGGAAASITRAKQRKLILAAQLFLQSNPNLARKPARFDVIAVTATDDIDWIRSAFTA